MNQPTKDRRRMIDEALRLWPTRELDRAVEAQFWAPQSQREQEERGAWRHIQAAATPALLRSWDAHDPHR